MAVRKVSFIQEEYYHIYNRGNSKQIIFHDKEDYERFIGLLYACNSSKNFRIFSLNNDQSIFDFNREKQLCAIGAYVLMPNHFHLLLTQIEDRGISKFMQKLTTAYVMYYNKKYKRTGSLFEGKFKSENADTDRYLKYLFSYIHLNPIKLIEKDWKEKGIKDKLKALEFLSKYKYSSFVDFLGELRIKNNILNIKYFPDYFPNKKTFTKEIMSWINYRND
jgi:putative transposase